MKTYPGYFNHFIMYTILLLVFTGINFTSASAQEELYRTSTGRLFIKADINNTPFNLSSNELLVQLDYETGKVVIRQEIKALIADNDSIQIIINNMKNGYIKFEGKLGLDYIKTTHHPPLDFQVEGTLIPQNIHIIGTGHLEHIAERSISACILSLAFVLEPDIVFPDNQFPALHKDIYIKVVQSLLSRVTD